MARKRSHTRRTHRANPQGVLLAHAGGFAFVQTAEGEFFVPFSKMNGAFDGDLVELAPLPSNVRAQSGKMRGSAKKAGHADGPSERPAARVLRVLDRAHDTLVGRYEVAEPFGVVVPSDPRIPYDVFTQRSERPDIEDGALVRVRIVAFPTRNSAATGVVEEVLGMADDDGAGIELIIARHKLETAFSPAALEEARNAQLGEALALAQGYRDIRDRLTFTIDPVDAKDFDDALSFERITVEEAGLSPAVFASLQPYVGVDKHVWRIGVHIADVSRYVPWNSSLDFDARRRATSVYLVDRVIPMLPHELSNDLCSLVPHETRCSMTVDLYVDDKAQFICSDIYPALIRSDARLTYDQAQSMLDCEDSKRECKATDESGIPWRLHMLSRMGHYRFAAREKMGGMDFSTVEAKVRLDQGGKPLSIDLRSKTEATSLVEEAMIFANEAVARYLEEKKFPCIFRVHEQPSPDSLAGLLGVFQEYPWFSKIDAGEFVAGNPKAVQAALELSKGRSEGELVSMLLLRAMKRAVYKPLNVGHYGLASKSYAHFTSPIRRYPDLVVHRMLRACLTKRPEKFDQEVASMPWIAEHSSAMERVADKAARESQEYKMIEYLEHFVGESFSAVVSGVAAYGIYARLDNTAEGFIALRELGAEYFSYDPVRCCLTGADTGKVYRLGQRIAVVLVAAQPQSGKLEFRLARS